MDNTYLFAQRSMTRAVFTNKLEQIR